MSDKPKVEQKKTSEDETMESRRKLLASAGRFALYTPPIIALLMAPGKKAFAQSVVPR